MFSQASVILSMGGGGVHGRGHVWQRRVCTAVGACVTEGGVHGSGAVCIAGHRCGRGCMWQGGMCGVGPAWQGECMVEACMAEVCMAGQHVWQGRLPL